MEERGVSAQTQRSAAWQDARGLHRQVMTKMTARPDVAYGRAFTGTRLYCTERIGEFVNSVGSRLGGNVVDYTGQSELGRTF